MESENGCPHYYLTFLQWTSYLAIPEWCLVASGLISCAGVLVASLIQILLLEQRILVAYFSVFACLNALPMLVPSMNRLIQLFIFMLGSQAVSSAIGMENGLADEKLKSGLIAKVISALFENYLLPLSTLSSLAYQTGLVRAASVIAQLTMLQEAVDCPLLLLVVNCASTMLGMAALNILRRRFSSRRLMACQAVMFIFTMQYSSFELASVVSSLPIGPLMTYHYAMFLYRVITSIELFFIAVVSTVIIFKGSLNASVHLEEAPVPP